MVREPVYDTARLIPLHRNVNGIRNPFAYQPWNSARTFPAMFDILGSDIVVMQELKIQRKDLRDDMVILEGWDCYFSLPKHKKGYSGVGIYTRNATCAPVKAEEGLLGVLPAPNGVAYRDMTEDQHIGGYPTDAQIEALGVDPVMLDAEGRCVALEFPAFVLFGVYAPANSNGMRDDFRHGFICALDRRIRNLIEMGKSVILVGDLNVSRDELDGASALEDCRKAGITHDEYISTPNRRIFNHLLIGGEVIGERDDGRESGVLWDTTRGFHPERKGMYTHWEQKINARPGNYGSRIDFVLVSDTIRSWIKDANIQEGLLGSDHCPVFVDFNEEVTHVDTGKKLLDIMSPIGTFKDGERTHDWRVQDVPLFSGRRLPEFNNRRSIKSMFAAPMTKSASSMSKMMEEEIAATQEPEKDNTMKVPVLQPSPHLADSPAHKRKSTSAARMSPPKRMKSDSAPVTGKGQKSLIGFFQPKTPVKTETAMTDTVSAQAQNTLDPAPHDDQAGNAEDGETTITASFDDTEEYSPASTNMTESPTKTIQSFEAREQTHRSWNALFSRPVAPLCESHAEPCKTMQTKKKGSNQGRSFWMCARPLGPSGNKERGTQWRCPTFIWSSDWDAKNGNGKDRNEKADDG